VGFPYVDLFLGLLVLYMIYSVWAGYDSRYPVVAALIVLVIAAIVDVAGLTDAANTLAIFVFFLLVAGVVLLLFDYIRESRAERVPRADPRSDAAGSAEPPSHVR
jgi:hypothetical protein